MQGEGQIYPAPTHKRVQDLDAKLARLQKSTRATFPIMVAAHNLLRQKFRWYYNWHMNSWASLLHWTALTGYTVAAILLLSTLVMKGPSEPILAASKQVWQTSDDWRTWQLDNLTIDSDGLRLAKKSVQGISTTKLAQATPVDEQVVTPETSTPTPTPISGSIVTPSPTLTPTATPATGATLTPGSGSTLESTSTPTTPEPTPDPSVMPPLTQYQTKGTATLAFNPREGEIVDWLSSESSETLNSGTITKEFSTDNILWTSNIKNLADADKAYLRLIFMTTDDTESPILNNFTLNYSRLPKTPQDLKVIRHMGILNSQQILLAGAFIDPDSDSHTASQWQVTSKSGEYTSTLVDSGIDTKNLISYKVNRKLQEGDYYFRVRYQDTTGAWSPWSEECAFTVSKTEVSVLGGEQVLQYKNELVDKRTETTKTLDNKNGTNTLLSFSGLVHYKESYSDPKALWKDINSNHSIDFPDFVLYDQMPSTVKVYKNKIGYEIESRQTGEKYTVELQGVDGNSALSTQKSTDGLVSWADINGQDTRYPSTELRTGKIQDTNKLNQFMNEVLDINPVLAQDEPTQITDNGNLKFEFQISPYGVRLWKTIDGPDAPKNFIWKVTKTGTGDTLKFRDNPEAFEIDASGKAKTDKPVEINARKIGGTTTNFTWQETAPYSDLKIDTDVDFNPNAYGAYLATSMDGEVARDPGYVPWSDLQSGAGTYGHAEYPNIFATDFYYLSAGTGWLRLSRSIFLFDTSTLPSNATVSAATLKVYGSGKQDNLSITPDLNVYESNPASNTVLANSDYGTLGTTPLSTAIPYGSFVTGGYNNFVLNATGRTKIDKTGITKLGLRNANYDAANSAPTPATSSSESYLKVLAMEAGTSTAPTLSVTYSSGITISGTCKKFDESTNCTDSETVKVAVNGAAAAQTTTTATGAWTITGVAVNSGDVVTVWVDGVADSLEANAVTKYDGTGDITGMLLYEDHLTIGSADNQNLSNTDLSQFDNSVSTDEDIFFDVTSGALTVDSTSQTTQDTLYIVASNTYRPDSSTGRINTMTNLNIAGTLTADNNTFDIQGTGTPFVVSGTFTPGTSLFKYTGGTTGTNITSITYYDLYLNHASTTYTAVGDITVSDVLTINAGTFNASSRTITLSGTTGTPFVKTGTLTPSTSTIIYTGDYTGGNTNIVSTTYYKLTLTSTTETYVAAGDITVSNVFTISASTTFDASSRTITLSGTTGTPFVKTGTFTASTSTLIYSGDNGAGNTTIVSTTYWNLQINNATETYVAAGTLDVNSSISLTLGTLSMGAYNLNLAGDFLNPGGTFTKGTGSTAVVLDGAGGTTQKITGSNNFNYLTMTATTARTINFASGTTQTVTGTWTATGASSQQITLGRDGGTGTNQWQITPTAWSVDYVIPTNSKNNAGSPINPAHYTDGGNTTNWFVPIGCYISATGGTRNWSDTASWVSGVVPTSADDVYANASSGSITVDTTANIKSLDTTGYAGTISAGAQTINVAGNWKWVGGTFTAGTSTVKMTNTSGTKTVTSGGQSFYNFTMDGVGGTTQFLDTFATPAAGTLTLTNGTLNTNNQAVNIGKLSSAGVTARTLTVGSSAITLTRGSDVAVWDIGAGTTYTANTAIITFTGVDVGMETYGKTYGGSVIFTGAGYALIRDGGSFNILTKIGTATKTDSIRFDNGTVVTGTLNINGNSSINRILCYGVTLGTPSNLTAANVSLSNVDFRDITFAGTMAGTASSSSIGDCGGNSGVNWGTTNFPTASADQHWIQAAGGNWSTASNWTSRVPLPQDNVYFNNAFSATQTVTSDMPRLGKSIDWTGATGNPKWAMNSINVTSYGSITLILAMSTLASNQHYYLEGRGAYTFTSAGTMFNNNTGNNTWLDISMFGGSLTLQDDYIVTSNYANIDVNNGTFNANNHNITFGKFSSYNNNTRTITMGSGTWTLSASENGYMWDILANGLTFNTNTSTIVLTAGNSGGTGHIFRGGSRTYNNIVINGGGTAPWVFSDANTFNNFTIGAPKTVTFPSGVTTTINGTFTANGVSGSLITINSSTPASAATISHPSAFATSWNSIKDITSTGVSWNASFSTSVSGNTGITFLSSIRLSNTGGNSNVGATWDGGVVPTQTTDIYADVNSGPLTVIGAELDVRSFDFRGYTNTLTVSIAFVAVGPANTTVSCYFGSGMTTAGTYNIFIYPVHAGGVIDLYTNGVVINTNLQIGVNSSYDGTTNFRDAVTVASTKTLIVGSGTLNTNNFAMSVGIFNSNFSNARTINLGSSNITITGTGTAWDFSTTTGPLTFNAGTSTITFTGGAPSFMGGGKAFNNVLFTGAGTPTLYGYGVATTFVNLTRTGTAVTTDGLRLSGDLSTVSGTLTLNGNSATNRLIVYTTVLGGSSTITAAAVVLSNVDFRDITFAGTMAGTATSSSIGDCGGNSGVNWGTTNFPTTADTETWDGTANLWSSAHWTGGSVSRVPLPQDTVILAGTNTVTADMPRLGKDISFSAAAKLTINNIVTSYGSLNFTNAGTLTHTNAWYFEGRDNYLLTSAGKTLFWPIMNAVGGKISAQDNTTISHTLTFLRGEFDTGIYSLNTGRIYGNNAGISTFSGSGSISIYNVTAGTSLDLASSSSLTWNHTGPITFSYASGSAQTLDCGTGRTFANNFTIASGGSGAVIIKGANTFNGNFTIGAPKTVTFPSGVTTTINGTFTANGTAQPTKIINGGTLNGNLDTWTNSTTPGGWAKTLGGTSTINQETSVVNAPGGSAARFDIAAGSNGTYISKSSLTVGKRYKATLYAKSLIAGAGLYVTSPPYTDSINNLTTSYQKYTSYFTAGATATFVIQNKTTTANSIYIDDITLEESADVELNASTPSSFATLSKPSGTVTGDYLAISDSHAQGGAVWNAGFNSTNTTPSTNAGWIFPAVRTWDGGGGADTNWSTTANWSADTVPTQYDDVLFNATSTNNVNIDTAATVRNFTTATGYTGTITANANLTTTNNFTHGAGTFNGGSRNISIAGNWLNTGGTFTPATSTVIFTATSGTKNITSAGQSFYNLTFSGAGGTFAPLDDMKVAGDFTRTNGTFTPGTYTVNLTGAGGSTQTITGDTTFNNLTATATAARTITFASSSVTTVTGTWTVTGAAGQLITLDSTSAAQWEVTPTAWNVDYVTPTNSKNNAGAPINPAHYTDGGSTTNWFAALFISGSCKKFNESTNCSDNEVIKLAYNGTLKTETGLTASGAWSIAMSTAPSSGDVVTAFVSGVADSLEANAVTKYDGTGSITGILLYEDHLTIGSDDNQNISNTNLSQYDNSVSSNEDIFFDVTSSNLVVDATNQTTQDEILIVAGNTYTPGGNVTVTNIDINGTFIPSSNTINVAGSWDATGGTFTNTSSTITFMASTTGKTITSASQAFNNLTFNNAAGGWTMSDAAQVNGNFTITTGAVTLPSTTLVVGGNFANNGGSFTHNSGSVKLTSLSSAATIKTGGSSFNNLEQNNGLVGHWKMDEGTGTSTSDSSVTANGGTLVGPTHLPTWTSTVKDASYYGGDPYTVNFDGIDNKVTIPSSANYSTGANGSFSYSAWIYSADYAPRQAVMAKRNNCSNDGDFNIYTLNNRVYLAWYSNLDAGGSSNSSTNAVLTNGQWYHITWVKQWGMNNVNLYVNGAMQAISGTSTLRGTTYSTPVYIGAQYGDNTCAGPDSNFFNGQIDDVRIYNRLLSSTDVGYLYDGTASTGTYTLQDNLAVAGNITISSGTLDASTSNYGVNIAGNYANNASFNPRAGTVTFSKASSTQTLNSGGTGTGKLFNALTHSGAGTLQLTTNAINVDGVFTNSAGTFDTNSLAQTYAGSFTNSATFTAGTTTATFDSTATGKTITSGSTTFGNVVFNSAAGGWSFSDAASITGNLTVTASETAGNGVNLNNQATTIGGNVAINGGKLTAGSSTINVAGNWDSSGGTFTYNTSTVSLTGTGNINLPDNSTFYNLSLASSTKTSTINTTTHYKSININNILTLNGGTLTRSSVSNTFVFLLRSSATPVVFASPTTISNSPLFYFKPAATGVTTVPGGNYGTAGLDISAEVTGVTFSFGGAITTTGSMQIESNITGATFATNNYTITVGSLNFPQGNWGINLAGTGTLNCGSSIFNISNVQASGTNMSYQPVYTIDMGSSTWNISGSWTNKTAATTVNLTPGTSTVNMIAVGTGKTITSAAQSFANLVFNGSGGGWTLQDDLTAVTATLTLGTLVDNAKTVTVNGNISVANVTSLLTSTGTWIQGTNGNVSNPFGNGNSFKVLQISAGVTSIRTGVVYAHKLVLGASATLAGANQLAMYYVADDFIDQGAGATITSGGILMLPSNGSTVNQKAITTSVTIEIGFGSTAIFKMTGNWTTGILLIHADLSSSTEAQAVVLDTNGNNLTVNGYVQLGANYQANLGRYPGKILFKTGTHSISGDLYTVLANGSGGTTNCFIDFASSTVNIGGNVNFTYSTVTSGTSTVNMTATSGTKNITSNGQSFNNFVMNGSGGTFAPLDDMKVAGNFTRTNGTFTPGTYTVNLTGAGGSTQTVTGSTTFKNLTATATAARTINFASSSVTTVTGTWTVTGAAGQLITLNSTSAAQWEINPTAWSVGYVIPTNSKNNAVLPINPANYTDGGSNTNWFLSISLSLDHSTLTFGNLLPGSVFTDTTVATVTANYSDGYNLSIQDNIAGSNSPLMHADSATYIVDYAGTIATATIWNGTGLGFCPYAATQKESKWGTGTTVSDVFNKYAGIPQNETVFHTATGSIFTNDQTSVGYKLVVPNSQKTGNYSGNIIYTATGRLP